jgi:hypothetical protein
LVWEAPSPIFRYLLILQNWCFRDRPNLRIVCAWRSLGTTIGRRRRDVTSARLPSSRPLWERMGVAEVINQHLPPWFYFNFWTDHRPRA